jgi:ABC-type transport system involved in multi-copper enzyme maturation permease subunit
VNALRAELLKATTTRLLLWFGLGLVAFIVLVVSVHVATSDLFDLQTRSNQRSLLEVAGLAAVLSSLVGSVLITNEYVHGTINQTFLAVPKRGRLLATKLASVGLVGAALGLLAIVTTLVTAALWFAGRGIHFHLDGGVWLPLLGALGGSMLAAAMGLGVGSILRRQTASVLLILLWLLIGENILAAINGTGPYYPGYAVAGVVAARGHATDQTLAFGPALLMCLLYVAALCGVGFALTARTDVPTRGE